MRDATDRPARDLVGRQYEAAGADRLWVTDIISMALAQRRPTAVIHHSTLGPGLPVDTVAFGRRCCTAGVRPSMGSLADAYDNALGESVFVDPRGRLFDRRRFRALAAARLAVFDFIEASYHG